MAYTHLNFVFSNKFTKGSFDLATFVFHDVYRFPFQIEYVRSNIKTDIDSGRSVFQFPHCIDIIRNRSTSRKFNNSKRRTIKSEYILVQKNT